MKNKLILTLVFTILVSTISVGAVEINTPELISVVDTETTITTGIVEEDVVLQLTISDAVDLAIENSWDIELLDINISEVNDMLENQEDLQDTMEKLLSLPLMFTPKDITNDFLGKLLIKRGYGVKSAEVQKTTLEETKKQMLEAIEIGAKQAYYQVLIAEKTLSLQEKFLEKAEQHQRIANVKYENGVATKLVKLQADTAYVNAKSDYQDAEDTLNIRHLEFNNTIGLNFEQKFDLISEIEYAPADEIELEESIKLAIENRADIKKSKAKFELQEVETGTYKSYYTGNLRVYKDAVKKLLIAEHDYEQSFKDVELDVRQKYLELIKAERALENINESVEIAKEALRVTNLFYEYDLATLTDVIDAETSLTQAEIGSYQLMVFYNINKMLFENALGAGLPSSSGGAASSQSSSASSQEGSSPF